MHAIELVDKSVVGTTMGYHGLLSGLGSAIGGYPVGKIIFELGWEFYFITCAIFSILSAILVSPLWNHKLSISKKSE